jgi:hypothetical protein
MEVPYYHGPLYDVLGDGIHAGATFHALSLPGRLAIDNPLDGARFERDMAGKPAILDAKGARGRAVLFSPHPEMGDLLRKYIALDGYVRRYLPIRGFATMRDTLRHYRVSDAPSFRLVANAVHALMSDSTTRRVTPERPIEQHGDDLAAVCRGAFESLPAFGAGEQGDLLRDVASRIGARLEQAAARDRTLGGGAAPATAPAHAAATERAHCATMRAHLAGTMRAHLAETMRAHCAAPLERPVAQQLMELDLGVALLEGATRLGAFDRALAAAT